LAYQSAVFDVDFIRDAKAAGYDVKAAYLATEDPNLNLRRVLIRVNNGGPFAAISRIPEDFSKGLRQLTTLSGLPMTSCFSTIPSIAVVSVS